MEEFVGVVPPEAATGELWPQIAALIERAIPYGRGEYTLGDIREGLRREEMFALVVMVGRTVEFVMTCSVCEYPRKRVLYIQYGAGRGGHRAKDKLLVIARLLRCDWVESRCRVSVSKVFEKVGFDPGYQVCILEVGE